MQPHGRKALRYVLGVVMLLCGWRMLATDDGGEPPAKSSTCQASTDGNLVINPGFENWRQEGSQHFELQDRGVKEIADGWDMFDKGYGKTDVNTHKGNTSMHILGNIDRDASGKLLHHRGALQYLLFNQSKPEPLTFSAWSLPVGVEVNVYDNGDPVPDVRYVMSMDVRFMDGRRAEDIDVKFEFDTPQWHRQCLTLVPSHPIESVTVSLLFFGHIGTASFDDVLVRKGMAKEGEECWVQHIGGVDTAFKAMPFYRVAKQPPKNKDDQITIVTQLSMDRIHLLHQDKDTDEDEDKG